MKKRCYNLGKKRAWYKYILNLQTLQGYIFRILQHFGTKLSVSINLRILFLVVAEYFVLFA